MTAGPETVAIAPEEASGFFGIPVDPSGAACTRTVSRLGGLPAAARCARTGHHPLEPLTLIRGARTSVTQAVVIQQG